MSKGSNYTKKTSLVSEKGNYALGFLFILSVIGIVAIYLYSYRLIDIKGQCITNRKLIICIGLLIAGTAFALGALGGFLFGIPKSITNSTTPVKGYLDNDNLVQISDWLTKIFVGVGLTQLTKIPRYLQSLGDYLKDSWGGDTTASISSVCLVMYFLICGFLMSYLWTRLYFRKMLYDADEDINKKQESETAINAVIDEYTDSVNSKDPNALKIINANQTAIKQDIEKEGKTSSVISNILTYNEFSALIGNAKQKMQNGLMVQSSISDDKKDPNKNQWGGKLENNERKISANVTPVDDSGLYKVALRVESTNLQNPMKEGDVVLFSLHNSFPDPLKIANVKGGIAKLEIISYGAFTVGAYVNLDNTELELDLTQLPDVPKEFKEN